jgi:iron(III) transport system ATP-binding protein
MNLGKVEQIDTPQNVYRKPATAFVANFIGRTNFVPATVREVAGGTLVMDALGGALQVVQPEMARQAGEAATLVVRPDAIRLTEETGQFSGVVHRSTYLGSQVEYEIEVAGQPLIVVESDPRHIVVFPPNTQVGVNLLVEAIYVLP